jgi:twitching motility two-component system response regulator PilG
MQGYLQEIDIRSILRLIELGQRTGQLVIEGGATSINKTGNSTTHLQSNPGLGRSREEYPPIWPTVLP